MVWHAEVALQQLVNELQFAFAFGSNPCEDWYNAPITVTVSALAPMSPVLFACMPRSARPHLTSCTSKSAGPRQLYSRLSYAAAQSVSRSCMAHSPCIMIKCFRADTVNLHFRRLHQI